MHPIENQIRGINIESYLTINSSIKNSFKVYETAYHTWFAALQKPKTGLQVFF